MGASAKPKTLADGVYSDIRAEILCCRLVPGTRIKINELCAHFGVSLGAVRESLSRLSAEGLVVAEAQRGYRVAPVSIEDLQDLTAARVDIENLCLARSMNRGGVQWESSVVGALYRLSHTPYSAPSHDSMLSDQWAQAHDAFHEALVAACDSQWLLRMRRILYEQSERYRRLSVPMLPVKRNVQSEHKALADAAVARNHELISTLMRDHLFRTANIIVEGMKVLAAQSGGADD